MTTLNNETTQAASIVIYADGSSLGNRGPSGCGCVLLLLDEAGKIINKAEVSHPMPFITTNNRAELTAALRGLALMKELQAAGDWPALPVTIISDAKYLIVGMSEWLAGWVKKGWRNAKKKPVENRDLWEALITETEGLSINWQWVRGHSGNIWNERADLLATMASAEAASRGVTFEEHEG